MGPWCPPEIERIDLWPAQSTPAWVTHGIPGVPQEDPSPVRVSSRLAALPNRQERRKRAKAKRQARKRQRAR